MRLFGAVHQRQQIVQASTTLQSVRDCGRKPRPGAQLEVDEVFDGLKWHKVLRNSIACRKAWICPRCQARECFRRSEEVMEVVQHRRDARVWTGIVTVGHAADDSLASSLDHIMSVWSDYAGSNCENTLYASRFIEVTWSERGGWHPHIHALIVSQGQAVPAWWDTMQRANAARALRMGRTHDIRANAAQPWRSDADGLSYFARHNTVRLLILGSSIRYRVPVN